MKHLLLTTIAAVVLVGCGESQQSAPAPKTKPIHDATQKGDIEGVKQHLAAGADVNVKDDSGLTPLHYAGGKEIAEILIAEGADVNAKSDGSGVTPLHFAADRGHTEVVELLITAGADVNAKNTFSVTPLHSAASEGHKEVGELLIAEGADVNVTSILGTPLDQAEGETADLLRKHGGKTSEELKAEGK